MATPTRSATATDGPARRSRRIWGAFATLLLVSTAMVVGAQPSGALTTTKTVPASCKGADAGSDTLLKTIGDGTLEAPIKSVTEAPQFVEPGQTGVPFKINWSLAIGKDLADTASAVAKGVNVSNVKTTIAVEGPTSTKSIPVSFPPQSFPLVAGQPINSAFPPVSGTLNDIGNSGIIKLKSSTITFSIQLTGVSAALANVAGKPINLTCSTGTTLASIPVKIAGSPDIVQPIEVSAPAGSEVSVDVLGQYVTNGVTKEGVEQQVDPSTLKVVEGDARVENGQIVATAPGADATADVTFEVCAGTIEVAAADPGLGEEQEIRIFFDPANQGGRRQIGVQFGFAGVKDLPAAGAAPAGEAPAEEAPAEEAPAEEAPAEDADTAAVPSGDVLWTAVHARGALGLPIPAPYPNGTTSGIGEFLRGPVPEPWPENVNTYAFQSDFAYPSAEMVQAALESVPTIGPGNVEVTGGEITPVEHPDFSQFDAYQQGVLNGLFGASQYRPYKVKFVGDLANRAVPNIITSRLLSFLPSEIASGLTGALQGGGDEGEDGGEEEPKIPIPGAEGVDDLPPPDGPIGGDARTYIDYLFGQIDNYLIGTPEWTAAVDLWLKVLGENILALIDLDFALSFLGLAFQSPPAIEATTEGQDPTPAEIQELCSQGVITLTGTAAVAGIQEANTGTGTGQGGAPMSFTG